MRRLLLVLGLMLVWGVRARAQSLETFFWLDPDDANNYAEFCRREYRLATKQNGPKAAAQILDNYRETLSMLPTKETAQTGREFWSIQVPEWWKRVSTGIPGSSKSGQASQNVGMSRLWTGLTAYQRMRATLRASALAYQSLKGLRFEVDAWKMMKNLLVMQEGVAYGPNGHPYLKVPRGSVSVSVVPLGKENWRTVLTQFSDSPWDDPNHTVRWIGPTKLSDVAIEADELGGDPNMTAPNEVIDFLQKVDAGARTAATGIMTVQMGVDQRRREAMNDAFSPKRLASSVRILNKRILAAYGGVLQLRAMLEGRSLADLEREYQALAQFSDDQARAAKAQAEMSAKFYSDIQDQAANIVSELEIPERREVIAKIEKEYEAVFNASQQEGVLTDIDKSLHDMNKVLTQLYPALAPYVGGMMIPIDTLAAITGTVNQGNSDSANPDSDIQAAYRDARVRAIAVRLNWELFQELRGARRLAALQEQVRAANSGLNSDQDAWQNFSLLAREQNERAAQLYRMHLAETEMSQWAGGS